MRNVLLKEFNKYVAFFGPPSQAFSEWDWRAREDWECAVKEGRARKGVYQGPAWDNFGDALTEGWKAKRKLQRRYSWAIPIDPLLERIAELGPIVEVGAGTGYWAGLLRDNYDVNVQCFDVRKHLERTPWTDYGVAYAPMARGDEYKAVAMYPERTLFLCWPYLNRMAYNAVRLTRAEYIVYVGEHEGGCCANDEFFGYLGRIDYRFFEDEPLDVEPGPWEQVDEIDLPQWPGLHDYCTIYRRTT